MSLWFRRRRRPDDAVTGAPPEPEPEVAGEPRVIPEPESHDDLPPEPESEAAPQTDPNQEGEISSARLDQALDRLRRQIPVREDGPQP